MASVISDGVVELALHGDDSTSAAVLFRAMSAGHVISSFAPVASDLEELFLQVTAPPDDQSEDEAA